MALTAAVGSWWARGIKFCFVGVQWPLVLSSNKEGRGKALWNFHQKKNSFFFFFIKPDDCCDPSSSPLTYRKGCLNKVMHVFWPFWSPPAQMTQHLAAMPQRNWSRLNNGGQGGRAAFNQLEMRQKEAFIMLHLGGERWDIKKASLILISFLGCQGFSEMSFHGAQPPREERFQVTLIAPPPS